MAPQYTPLELELLLLLQNTTRALARTHVALETSQARTNLAIIRARIDRELFKHPLLGTKIDTTA